MPSPAKPPPADAPAALRRLAGLWIKLALAVSFVAICYDWRPFGSPEHFFLWYQDLPVLVGCAGLLLLATRIKHWPELGLERLLTGRGVALAALAVFITGGLGVGLVFRHYTLSLDEFLADFDAAIYRHGLVMAPVPPLWRPYVPALQPIYMLEVPDHSLWASSYLPINAMLRAGADVVHLRDWLNPLFTAIGVIATWAVGRQLWPEHPRRAAAAALLLATGAQLLVNAMTSYAMPAHLALNMVWLWFFLKGRKLTDIGALAIGFVTSGLHQVIFHPLFAGFFILDLWLKRRWGRAALFTAGYAAICLFWIAYWGLLYRHLGVSAEQAGAVGAGGFAQRVVMQLQKITTANIGQMAESLVRFVSWQNVLVPGLAIAGALSVMRKGGPLRAMALAILATSLAMAILVPTQTHGWGYRYLHGLLGAACLLAVQGWVSLTESLPAPERQVANRALATIGLISAVVLLPLRGWQAHTFSEPYRSAAAAIEHTPADFVLVDNGRVGFDMGSFVRNDPLLAASPKVFLLGALTPAHLDDLCKRGKVWVFDAKDPSAAGILTFDAPWATRSVALRDHLRQSGCAS